MEVKKAIDRVIEIDSHYNLMQVFNAINQDKSSLTFSYHGIFFWKNDHIFLTDQQGVDVRLGKIVDFDEFKGVLGIHS